MRYYFLHGFYVLRITGLECFRNAFIDWVACSGIPIEKFLCDADLADLIQRESQLRARLKREQRSSLRAQGLGDPNRLHVRF